MEAKLDFVSEHDKPLGALLTANLKGATTATTCAIPASIAANARTGR